MIDSLWQDLEIAKKEFQKNEFPFVTISYAQSMDGCLSERHNQPTAISNQKSLVMTHKLRSLHQGILIGSNTLNSDDPSLNVRLVEGPSPQRVVVSSSLSLNLSGKIFTDNNPKPWVTYTGQSPKDKVKKLKESGLNTIEVLSATEGICLRSMLKELKKSGIESVMVEGGCKLIDSFIRENLVDYLVITCAPFFMANTESSRLEPGLKFEFNPKSGQLDNNLLIWGSPV